MNVDSALTFLLHQGAFRGRVIRLPATTADILARHDYPPAVARLVGEAAALACALAFAMKFDGVFTLQAQGNGPVHMLVADVTSDGEVRACARFDADAVAALETPAEGQDASVQRLLGAGHLAFTVDQGPDTNRYQGIVELEGTTLAECIQQYFRRSEQLATAIKVAADPVAGGWRGAAVMLQRMPADGGVNHSGLTEEEADDAWHTAVVLLGSLTRAELLDPALATEQVAHRLFHGEHLALAEPKPLRFGCRCSRERVETTLASFPAEDLDDMRMPDGTIEVHCQFCGTRYAVDPTDLATRRDQG